MVFAHRCCVFAVDNWATFALFQSSGHELWARTYSSSLETRLNYSPSDCFETFPFPPPGPHVAALAALGETYHAHRRDVMLATQLGLTKTYNRFHDPKVQSTDIARLRELHVAMDRAVAAAYGWSGLDLGHGFHKTKQGTRFTLSEPARREVLDRLLALNHERHADEVRQGLHETKKSKTKATAKKSAPRPKSEASSLPDPQARLFPLPDDQ